MQANARITNLELAEKIGLSPTPCARRVKQLEEAGIIERHVTLLNQQKLGLNITAMIGISMDRHTPERFENFERTVRAYTGGHRMQHRHRAVGRLSAEGGSARHDLLRGISARPPDPY